MAAAVSDVDLLRRRVLNVVGHELRTPVSTLSGLATALESCEDAVERQALSEAVARNARLLDHLVDDLLLAAGVTTVVPIGEPEPVDLVAVVHALWTGATASVSGAATALARPDAVRRALSEVLDNATIHGAAPFSIAASVVDGRAVVEIANGGAALSDDELALATELFFRGERAVTTKAGLGVGLAMARTLLQADGGDLTLAPREGGGIVARIELPAA
jgi:two-component system phosphate regulon sensor histidine kinase PhoR